MEIILFIAVVIIIVLKSRHRARKEKEEKIFEEETKDLEDFGIWEYGGG